MGSPIVLMNESHQPRNIQTKATCPHHTTVPRTYSNSSQVSLNRCSETEILPPWLMRALKNFRKSKNNTLLLIRRLHHVYSCDCQTHQVEYQYFRGEENQNRLVPSQLIWFLQFYQTNKNIVGTREYNFNFNES